MQEIYAEVAPRGLKHSTVRKWVTGTSEPTHQDVRELIAYCVREGGLDATWTREMASLGGLVDADAAELLADLYPDLAAASTLTNLPPREHKRLHGRDDDLAKLALMLQPSAGDRVISIDGVGGIGKTALALEAAHRCRERRRGYPSFDVILYVSAKEELYLPTGRVSGYPAPTSLLEVFETIADALGKPHLLTQDAAGQFKSLLGELSRQSSLLIVDNLEDVRLSSGIRHPGELQAFLHDPRAGWRTRVIMTSRVQYEYAQVVLNPLDADDSRRLITEVMGDDSLDPDDVAALIRYAGGLPIAMVVSCGRLRGGADPTVVIRDLAQPRGELGAYCFERSVAELDADGRAVALAVAVMPGGATREALRYMVTGANSEAISRAIGLLRRRYLVDEREGRIHMQQLLRSYILAALPEGDRAQLLERRESWAVTFVRRWGSKDDRDWVSAVRNLRAEWDNIQSAMQWCVGDEFAAQPRELRYYSLLELWKNLGWFTHVAGLWAVREFWSDLLIQESIDRGLTPTAVEILSGLAWTIADRGERQRLEVLRERLTVMSELGKRLPPFVECTMLSARAMVAMRLEDYRSADADLTRAEELAPSWAAKRDKFGRAEITVRSLRAEWHLRGSRDFTAASSAFHYVMGRSASIGWSRSELNAELWSHEVALERGTPRSLDAMLLRIEATLDLTSAWPDAKRTARLHLLAARAAAKAGDLDATQVHAAAAQELFDELGMSVESNLVADLLRTASSH